MVAKIEKIRVSFSEADNQVNDEMYIRGMARIRNIRSAPRNSRHGNMGVIVCVTAARRALMKKWEKNAEQLTPIETFIAIQIHGLSVQRRLLAEVMRVAPHLN